MTVLRVIEPFSTDVDGVPRVFPAGALVQSTDQVVNGREQFFMDAAEFAERSTKSTTGETASAAPGEVRLRGRAMKRTAAQKRATKKALAEKAPPSGAGDGEPDPESGPSQIPGVNRDPSATVPEEGDGSEDDTSGPSQIPGENDDPDATLPKTGDGSPDQGTGGPGSSEN